MDRPGDEREFLIQNNKGMEMRKTKDAAKIGTKEFLVRIHAMTPLDDSTACGNQGCEGFDEEFIHSDWFGTVEEANGWLNDVLLGQHTLSEIAGHEVAETAGVAAAYIERHRWDEESWEDDEFGLIVDAFPVLEHTWLKMIEGKIPDAVITYSEEWSE